MFKPRETSANTQSQFWLETKRLPKANAFYRKLDETLSKIGLTADEGYFSAQEARSLQRTTLRGTTKQSLAEVQRALWALAQPAACSMNFRIDHSERTLSGYCNVQIFRGGWGSGVFQQVARQTIVRRPAFTPDVGVSESV